MALEQIQSSITTYMSDFFPFEDMAAWLTYRGRVPLNFREISHTSVKQTGEDVYCRYGEYISAEQWRSIVLNGRAPYKFDFGAIYDREVRCARSGTAKPTLRELVFDIDSADFDHLRRCGCTGREICAKCWLFMSSAVRVILRSLGHLDCKQNLVVFSGGRGVHIWATDGVLLPVARHRAVADTCICSEYKAQEEARMAKIDQDLLKKFAIFAQEACSRSAVGAEVLAELFSKQHGASPTISGASVSPEQLEAICHDPSYNDIYNNEDAASLAAAVINAHDYFTLDGVFAILAYLLPSSVCGREDSSSLSVHHLLAHAYLLARALTAKPVTEGTIASALAAQVKNLHPKKFDDVSAGYALLVRMHLTAPRIDTAVTVQLNHLLKAPFSIHARSTNVCLPLCATPEAAEAAAAAAGAPELARHFCVTTFDPTTCPFKVQGVLEGEHEARKAFEIGKSIFSDFVNKLDLY